MGLFGRKKNTEASSSVLSESEIQKKLYGEFSDRISSGTIGDRGPFKDPASLSSKEFPAEKEAVFDLFSVQREALSGSDLSSSHISPEQKPADQASRYVPLHDFEKKSVSSVPASSSPDPYARFRNRPRGNKRGSFWDKLNEFPGEMSEFLKPFFDPRRVALRRALYWGIAVLVIGLLFGGVNALNSQREEAIRVRYKIPGPSVSESTFVPVAKVISAKPAAERPVVITPAPVRPKNVRVSEGSTVSAVPVNGSYVIQVVTYPTRQDAELVVETFKQAGLRAFVKENIRPTGKVFYLVLLGGYRTETEAQAQLLKFRAKEVARPFQDAFVKVSRS